MGYKKRSTNVVHIDHSQKVNELTSELAQKTKQSAFIKVGNNEQEIRDAVTTLSANGGGEVLLPPERITLTSPLPLVEGVKYKGIEPELIPLQKNVPYYMGDMTWNYGKGTVLVGDGTFNGMEANIVDLDEVPTALGDTQVSGTGAINIGFENFKSAIRIGAKNTIGAMYSEFRNLYAKECKEWGFYFVNFQHTKFDRLYTSRCKNNQYYGSLLPGSVFMPGNSAIGSLYAYLHDNLPDNRHCRGIVFEAGGEEAHLNEIRTERVQVNAMSRSKLSDTVTITSGSADLSVADGTKYLMGMPIVFTSSLAGFNAGQCYVIKSVNGNTIQLAHSKVDAAIIPNASGTLTSETYGFPNVEFSRLNSNAKVSHSYFQCIDVEGLATVALYSEASIACHFDIVEVPATNQITAVLRNTSYSSFTCKKDTILDADGNSTTSSFNGVIKSAIQRELLGQWINSGQGNQYQWRLSTLSLSKGGDIKVRGGNKFLYPETPFGTHVYPRIYNITLAEYHCGVIVANKTTDTTSEGNFTLPIINETSEHSNNLGVWYEVVNVGTYDVIVNTQNSQTFNNLLSKTSVTVPPQNTLKVVATKLFTGQLVWIAKLSSNGIV